MKDKILDAVMNGSLAIFGICTVGLLGTLGCCYAITAWRLAEFLAGGAA